MCSLHHSCVTLTLLQSADSQKTSFGAVWEGIHDDLALRAVLTDLLHALSVLVNQTARALVLSGIASELRRDVNIDVEHAANVTEFLTVLAGLTPQAIGEMHEMTVPPPVEDVGGEGENASHVPSAVTDPHTTGTDPLNASCAPTVPNSVESNAVSADRADSAFRADRAGLCCQLL